MFNFKKSNSGKIRIKLIAALLVLTLTFTNFVLVGSYIGQSIAAEIDLSGQGTETQSENVEFNVYLDEVNSTVREKDASISSEDMKLYVSVNVKEEGYLNNATIELVNTNFKFKNSPETTSIKLDSIQAEDGFSVGIPVVAKNDESYNLSLLDMESQIRLVGEYVDAKENITEIDTNKAVKITWTTDELTDEDIVLTQNLITNKIYSINGANKRVIQLLVKSQIAENKAPVESTSIEIANPGTLIPEDVKVVSYGTKATNGKTSAEFEKTSWEYRQAEGKTYINILNNPTEENNISWAKNTEDIFVITYVYDENEVLETPFISNVKSTIDIYGRTEEAIEKTSNLTLETVEEVGAIVALDDNVPENIYKGNMYLGEDTNYEITSNIYVPYSKIAKGILYAENTDDIAEGVSTYFKTTKINKADVTKVLGANGKIVIYNTQDMINPVKTISLATEQTEEDYYTISYGEGIDNIIILMGSTNLSEGIEEITLLESEGTIEIINEKAIKVEDKEIVSELTELSTNTVVQLAGITDNNLVVNNSIVTIESDSNKTASNLLEPKTTFDISLEQKSLSNQIENDLSLTVELKAQNESNKLFNSPIVNIELPAEITEASIENITPVVGDDELTLGEDNYEIVTNEDENKVVQLNIQGMQTEYSPYSATITVDLKVKTSEFMADKTVDIKAVCINDPENEDNTEIVESKETVKLTSKKELITKNTLQIGENVIEKINQNTINANITENTNANVNTSIINNFGEKISNINIVGNVPNGIILTNSISSNAQGVAISYSEDLTNWETEVTDYSKIKAFKINLAEMTNGSQIDLSYGISANIENIEENTQLTNSISINYEINEQAKQEKIDFILNAIQGEVEPEEPVENAQITITPKTTINSLYEGQIVTYNITAKNTGVETLNNVTLDYNIPEGAVVTELTYAQSTDVRFTDDESIKNKIWAIETLNPNETITKEITLKIKKGATQIINSAKLKDAQNNVLADFTSAPTLIREGQVTAILSRIDNMEIDLSNGSSIEYVVIVKNNTSASLNNVKIVSQVPEQTIWVSDSEYNQNWQYDNNSKEIEYTINTLPIDDETTEDIDESITEVRFEVRVDEINNSSCEAKIENTAVVILESGEDFETNIFTSNVRVPKLDIHMRAEHNNELNEGGNVRYIITVSNTGKRATTVYVEDTLPEEIKFTKSTHYTDENNKIEDTITKQTIDVLYPVEVGETLTIILEGVTYNLDDNTPSKQISNVAKLYLGEEEFLESETITNTIVNDKVQTGNNGDSDGDVGGDSDGDKDQENGKYSISGLAWIDTNKDGIRNNNEELLQAVKVMLLDKQGKQISEATTSLTGTYKFTNLEQAEYTVAFEYDKTKYAVTKYQVSNATQQTNSDVISKEITINGKNIVVGITDTLKIEDENITNIDLGLVQNPRFDLSLNKYITKTVVTNNSGTITYEYDDTNLAKVEISAKQIAGSTLLVEYEIQVTNNGDVNGYVTDIIDYLPKELEFNSEMNTEWYLGTDNYLHYMALDPQAIEPGKTQTVKLILTKTLKSNSTGTIENTAEIAEGVNLQGIPDIDSSANNKQEGEDDISKASLIISIKTGSPMMYIGIIIACITILGIGIYIIDKKILKVRI